jgi:hypothetical protein
MHDCSGRPFGSGQSEIPERAATSEPLTKSALARGTLNRNSGRTDQANFVAWRVRASDCRSQAHTSISATLAAGFPEACGLHQREAGGTSGGILPVS